VAFLEEPAGFFNGGPGYLRGEFVHYEILTGRSMPDERPDRG